MEILLIKLGFNPTSHIFPIYNNELYARYDNMYDFLASSGHLESENLQSLVDCMSPSYGKPTVMFGLLSDTFIFNAVGFSYVTVAPVYAMDVLYWFGGCYGKLPKWYNLFTLLHVNVFTPPHFNLVFHYLLYLFTSTLLECVALI